MGRIRAMRTTPYLLATVLGICAAVFFNGQQEPLETQKKQVGESTVERDNRARVGAANQVSNAPYAPVVSDATFPEGGTDSGAIALRNLEQPAVQVLDVSAPEDRGLIPAAEVNEFWEELISVMHGSGIPQGEMENILDALEEADRAGDLDAFHKVMEQAVFSAVENLEGNFEEMEAILTDAPNQEKIEQLMEEIEAMTKEDGTPPEAIAAMEKKIEELERLLGGHDGDGAES